MTDETSRPWFGELSCKDLDCFIHDVAYESIKPYLRPMSSMTEEEKLEVKEYLNSIEGKLTEFKVNIKDTENVITSIRIKYAVKRKENGE